MEITDLGAYQQAVRQVLTRDLITATRPRPGVLEQVLPWADQLVKDFRDLFGYQLVATTHLVRLVRRFDGFDATQGQLFAKNGRAFDRRRLAYLCLVLGSFQRSRVEISLADLVRLFTPAANGIAGLGFEPTVTAHKAALVDALDWLVERGALRLSDGSLESWAHDDGDALYDIDHEICTVLFKPARPVQHLTSAAGLLYSGMPDVLRTARRLLLEQPVVYFAEVPPEIAEVLPRAADELAGFTGLKVERRAEGVMLADPSGRFTDRPFPGRGGAVNRAAGLLLAKIADLTEEVELQRLTVPGSDDLLARIDAGLPTAGIVQGLAWTPAPSSVAALAPAELWFVEQERLAAMVDSLYTELGAASFTSVWQADPAGLLTAAVTFLNDLHLLRSVPGGVLVLPAAFRYRNISLALPQDPRLPFESESP